MMQTELLPVAPQVNSQTALSRYRHTLSAAYRIRGVDEGVLSNSFPMTEDIVGKNPIEIMEAVFPTIRQRLAQSSLRKTLLKAPKHRVLNLLGKEVFVPIINSQGEEWYADSPMANFDFVAESELGLHENAKVIYDFGGHHGVWAMYYSLVVGEGGRVYTFEPSILNIEVSSLLFLMNATNNVVNCATAIGADTGAGSDSMLIDFVDNDSIEIMGIRDACWDYADFLKMDIEGFEYDVLTRNPWLFDAARHMHIEVHIPHLEARGLDYRNIMNLIPFQEFDVYNHSVSNPVTQSTELSGFCSLMMRRR